MSSHLGYANTATGTLGIIQSIVGLGQESTTAGSESGPSGDAALQYGILLRQLPPPRHMDILVRFFFTELAWQYDIVDEQTFLRQLRAWEQVSYAARREPSSLAPALRHFPPLLFQVLAQALLFQPVRYDRSLDDLLHAPGMDLVDLAAEFSDAGSQVASTFGIRDVTLVKVQTGLLRACFQKTTGSVAEAWHTLGGTIRDAQELGLHRLEASDEPGSAVGSQQAQQVEMGRKMWLVLHLWDGHMAVVLGRPMATELNPDTVPSSGHEPNEGNAIGDGKYLTPFDVILCGYHVAYKYLQDIYHLESVKQDVHKRVDAIHSSIMANITHMPTWAQSQSLHGDGHRPWLPAARETLTTEIHFTILALHRPFIFSHPSSRVEAFTAGLRILESQSRLFASMEPRHYVPFNLVFATFDAVVIVAATYILFPSEKREHIQSSLTGVRWALERLHAMRARNRMAGSAYDVVKVMYGKMLNRVMAVQAPPALSEDVEEALTDTIEQGLSSQTSLQEPEPSSAVPQHLDNIMPPQPLQSLISHDFTADSLPTEMNGEPLDVFLEEPMPGDEFWRIINDLGR